MKHIYNLIVAGAYFSLLLQLVGFMINPKVLAMFEKRFDSIKVKYIFHMVQLSAVILALLIGLCGNYFLTNGLLIEYPENQQLKSANEITLLLFTIVAVITAVFGFCLFPMIIRTLGNIKLNQDGQLEISESYMIEIVNLLKESVVVLSPEGVILRGNEISSTIFGSSFIDQPVSKMIHSEDRGNFQSTLVKVMDTYDNQPISIEYRVKKLTTERSVTTATMVAGISSDFMWVESTFCKGTQVNFMGQFEYDIKMVTHNIDALKRGNRYRQYFTAVKEKEAINEAKMRYISCIAHDLKTPLQSFCFTLDALQSCDLTAEQMELVEQTNIAVDLMKLTISQTMDISKALTGAALMPRRRSVDFPSIVERVKVIINGYGKQVPVSFEVSPYIAETIITDEEWLWQMLLNLLTNACKYTDRGGIQVKVSLTNDNAASTETTMDASAIASIVATATAAATITAGTSLLVSGLRASLQSTTSSAITDIHTATQAQNHFLLFEVIDTGVGIRNEKLDSIFEAFAQVQKGQVSGTGLGLFGVRRRAEGLGGSCGARHNTQSSTGTGTVMWFTIPYVVDDLDGLAMGLGSCSAKSNGSGRLVPSFATMDTMTPRTLTAITNAVRRHNFVVIVVDDTLMTRKLMEKALLQMGFARVECYGNGSKGLEAMMAQQVDLVFTDVQMPIMTGPEMVRRFRTFEEEALASGVRTRQQMVVMASANPIEEDGEDAGGFDMVLAKPISRSELASVLLQYLRSLEAMAAGSVTSFCGRGGIVQGES